MICLGVDTSTPSGSIGLAEDGRLLGELNLTAGHHQQRLLPCVDLLLNQAGSGIARVDSLAVALGPGTFTGLRVGIATVKGLALARGVPAYGVSTLLLLGVRHRHRDLPVAAMIEAGRGRVYTALHPAGGELDPARVAERETEPDEFLRSLPGTPVLFCGSGVALCRDRIPLLRGERDIIEPEPVFLGGTLALWGGGRLKEKAPWSLADLKPNYIRLPDAEISAKGRRPASI